MLTIIFDYDHYFVQDKETPANMEVYTFEFEAITVSQLWRCLEKTSPVLIHEQIETINKGDMIQWR